MFIPLSYSSVCIAPSILGPLHLYFHGPPYYVFMLISLTLCIISCLTINLVSCFHPSYHFSSYSSWRAVHLLRIFQTYGY